MEEKLYRETLEKCVRRAHEQHNYITEEEYSELFAPVKMGTNEDQLTRKYLDGIKIRFGVYEKGKDTAEDELPIGNEDGKYLGFYLEELSGLKQYSEEEKQDITRRALDDEAEAKKELVNMHLQDVVDMAKLYVYEGVSLEDLIGEGNIGLMMGVDTLGCVESIDEVEGYLGKMIMDAMDAAIASDNDDREKLDGVLKRITDIGEKASELSENLRRAVTTDELARETGIDIDDIDEAMRITGNNIEGLVKPTDGN